MLKFKVGVALNIFSFSQRYFHFPNKGNAITFNNEMAHFLGNCAEIKKLKMLNVVIKDDVPLAIIAEKFPRIEYLH
jgi:hypothetical protein